MYLKCKEIWEIKDSCKVGPLVVISDPRLGRERNKALIRGEYRPKEAVLFRYQLGGAPNDLVETTLPGLYLLSNRVIEVLETARFTGWTSYPVRITGKGGEEISGYRGLSITGRCNPVDWPERLNPSRQPPFWDGSDIFLILNRNMIGVTNRVYAALNALQLSNVNLVRKDQQLLNLFPGLEFP